MRTISGSRACANTCAQASSRSATGSRPMATALTQRARLALPGEKRTSQPSIQRCCGGALAFSEPEKSQKQIKDIVESAYDHGAEMIVTPCPLCQANVEIYQGAVNKTYGTKFNIPVLYYSQLMALAYGGSAKEAGLDGHVIKATKLEAFAAKK